MGRLDRLAGESGMGRSSNCYLPDTRGSPQYEGTAQRPAGRRRLREAGELGGPVVGSPPNLPKWTCFSSWVTPGALIPSVRTFSEIACSEKSSFFSFLPFFPKQFRLWAMTGTRARWASMLGKRVGGPRRGRGGQEGQVGLSLKGRRYG